MRVLGYMVPLCSEQSLGFNVEKKKKKRFPRGKYKVAKRHRSACPDLEPLNFQLTPPTQSRVKYHFVTMISAKIQLIQNLSISF